jgi:hypothetical protein
MTPKSWDAKTGTQWKTDKLTMNGPTDPFNGYTLFEFRGKDEAGVDYTPGKYSESIVNATQDQLGIVETVDHELRHMFLGDFGRNAQNAEHSATFNADGIPKNNADKETKEAEDEAKANSSN